MPLPNPAIPEAEYVDDVLEADVADEKLASTEKDAREDNSNRTEGPSKEFDAQPTASDDTERQNTLRHSSDPSERALQALMDIATGSRRENSDSKERASGRPAKNRGDQQDTRKEVSPTRITLKYSQAFGTVRPYSYKRLTADEIKAAAETGKELGEALGEAAGKVLGPAIDAAVNRSRNPMLKEVIEEATTQGTIFVSGIAGSEAGPVIVEAYENRGNIEWNAAAVVERLTHIDTWRGMAGLPPAAYYFIDK